MSSEEKKPQLRIAIIGAGYAGLAAAVTIAQNNIPVTVFEAAEVLGGRARRVERRGVILDNGLHILLGAYRETLRLIALVAGAETPKLVRLPFRWEIAQHFRAKAGPFPAPLDLVFGLLLARGTTLPEKIAAIRFVQKTPSVTENCSVLDLLELGRQGENLVRFFWRPLCVAALNTPVEKASAQVFLNVVRAVLEAKSSDLIFAGEDLSRLFPDRAASYLKKRGGTVHIKHRITGLRKSQEGFELESPRGIDRFSHVVCALSPNAVAALIAGIPELGEIRQQIARFEYQPIHSIYLQYCAATHLDFPMLGLAGGPAHWVFDRGTLCGQHGLLGAVISSEGAHKALSHDELALRVHSQLKTILKNLPAPQWSNVIAEKRATIACVAKLTRPPQVTPLDDFFLAGDYTASELPATIESAVQSGVKCARLILAQLTQRA